jgi:hypothetical protein
MRGLDDCLSELVLTSNYCGGIGLFCWSGVGVWKHITRYLDILTESLMAGIDSWGMDGDRTAVSALLSGL